MTDVVVLVDPAADAAAVARELTASCVDASSRVLLAPEHLLGVAFLRDPESARWWDAVGAAADSVVVCRHRPELLAQLAADTVATWVVWCGDERELDECAARGQLGVLAAAAAELAAEVVARVLEPRGGFRRRPAPAAWGPFARRASSRTEDEPEALAPPPPPPEGWMAARRAARARRADCRRQSRRRRCGGRSCRRGAPGPGPSGRGRPRRLEPFPRRLLR